MKIVRIKYVPPLGPLIEDLQRVFPNLPITAQYLQDQGGHLHNVEKKRFVFVKEKFNESGVRTHVIVYGNVRDTFTVPNWIQGEVLNISDINNPIDHYFLGHEIPVPDDPNEPPEEEIV